MRGYLAEYATLQERIAAKLEAPDDIWGGLLNAEMAEDIRAYLAGVSPEPAERQPCLDKGAAMSEAARVVNDWVWSRLTDAEAYDLIYGTPSTKGEKSCRS